MIDGMNIDDAGNESEETRRPTTSSLTARMATIALCGGDSESDCVLPCAVHPYTKNLLLFYSLSA